MRLMRLLVGVVSILALGGCVVPGPYPYYGYGPYYGSYYGPGYVAGPTVVVGGGWGWGRGHWHR